MTIFIIYSLKINLTTYIYLIIETKNKMYRKYQAIPYNYSINIKENYLDKSNKLVIFQ